MRHLKIHFLRNTIVLILLMVSLSNYAFAQFSRGFTVGWGLKTSTLLFGNPGAKPFSESDPEKPPLFGGGFDGPQPGLELLFEFPVGDSKDFVIPFGIDYTFYRGVQRIPQTYYVLQDVENSLDITTLSLGLNYALVKYNIANAKIYAGLEIKASFVGKNNFTIVTNYKQLDSIEIISTSVKEPAVRIGGTLRFGIEGEIAPKWFVNINGSFGIMNLLGTDDSRGELLTPFKQTTFYTEKKESAVYTFHYTFLVLYRL